MPRPSDAWTAWGWFLLRPEWIEQPVRLFKQPAQILAPVTYVDNLNAVTCGPIDYDVASPGHIEATMVWTELQPGYPHLRMVHKSGALLLQPVDEAKRIGRAALSNIVMDLLKVSASFKGKGAAAHLLGLAKEALRCLSSSNTSPAGTT